MKASDILRMAAEIVEQNLECGCNSITLVFGENRYYEVKRRAKKYYASLFKNHQLFWFGRPSPSLSGGDQNSYIENNKHRVLALLLTADIAESVGD